MVDRRQQEFGGAWTEHKLDRLRLYLKPYASILRKRPRLRFAYIDAFAGTGERTVRALERQRTFQFEAHELRTFFDGSARLALQSEAKFHAYFFIERSKGKAKKLTALKAEFPDRADRIHVVNRDANSFLMEFFKKDWTNNRAVLFLDPFGMQVGWNTLAAAAATKAVDVWYLFPIGVAVIRLLKRDGKTIDPKWRRRLDDIFGTGAWFDHFYQQRTELSLFGPEVRTERHGSFDDIKDFFLGRLRTIFPGVASNPLYLTTSQGRPLYLLSFACANPNAVDAALDIAEDILGKRN